MDAFAEFVPSDGGGADRQGPTDDTVQVVDLYSTTPRLSRISWWCWRIRRT